MASTFLTAAGNKLFLTSGYSARMPSFDIVSEIDLQEVRNAVDQANREVVNRYDFKNTGTSLSLGDDTITVGSSTEDRVRAAIDVLQSKLIKRGVSLKALSGGDPTEIGGGRSQAVFRLNSGIEQEHAKAISKHVRDLKLKVQVQIQGDQLRVTGKKRDDLQTAIAAVKEMDVPLPLQYTNFRD